MLSLAFLANAGIGGWPNGGQAVAIGAILASRQAFGSNNFLGIYLLSLAFLAIAGIGGWPNGGQAVAIGAILASRQAFGSNI